MSELQTDNRLLCLDFDGVVCDSVLETGVAGWKTGCRVWADWNEPEPPEHVLAAFRRLRPLLHTGYEAALLMRIVYENPEIAMPSENEIMKMYADTLATTGKTREQMIEIFGATRDQWIAAEPADWRSRQRLFPGVAAALNKALESPADAVHIVTTKQRRFVQELLRAESVVIDDDAIHGLETGTKKELTLQRILAAGPDCARRYVLEDRLPTLEKIAATPELDEFELLYADWGYGHPRDVEVIARQPRIKVVSLPEFLAFLSRPGR